MKFNYDYNSRFRILKGGKISLVVSTLIAGVTLSYAAPSGGVVTSGSASIAQNGSVTTITQSSNKASINWQNFSIGSSETVNFNQPNVSAITLNRVVGNEKSVIDGALNANGQVWILNSNGVLFSKNASINTAGLVATTMNLSDADFMNGNYTFKGDSSASVINQGTINISDKGYAALFGKEVANEGIIKATLGKVHLTGANEITLNLNGNSLVSLHVNKGVLDALVENKGAIYADGGEVYLTTNAVNELLKGVVNNTGIIEANSIDDITGKIELYAHGGTTNISGTLEAKKGFIETSGETLHVKNDVNIKAKEWLLDPTDITITDGGADGINGSSIDADTITSVLNGGTGVTLTATNDIAVNEAITWTSATQLKLTSSNTIHVNATIANTNTTNGGVYFNAANTTDKVIFGASGKVIIYNPYQLQWLNQALNGKYELGGNIDASGTASWNYGLGFVPIGNNSTPFKGSLNGNGYVIDGLYIYRPMTSYVGLFGFTFNGSTIQNIGLTHVDITGQDAVGGLVGLNYSSIINSYVSGSVSGSTSVGGLVGDNSGSITNNYATSSVNGSYYAGGLVGLNNGSITNSYATGSVNGSYYAGGLVGYNFNFITNSYATGRVSDTVYVGGLVGEAGATSTIINSYWDIDTTWQTTGVGINIGALSNVVGIHSTTGTINAFTQSTYGGFDFTNTWYMINGQTRPFLRSEYSTNITNDHQLQLMAMNLTAHYTLANNITYTGTMWSSAGFVPVGNDTTKFTGWLNGNGYVIDGLTIYLPGTDYVGLFGYTHGSEITDVDLTNVTIVGHNDVGALMGATSASYITYSSTSGSVSGVNYVGGLVGYNNGSTIVDDYTTSSVRGTDYVGGLVGYNWFGTIAKSYATSSVNGRASIGGLVGSSTGAVNNSYAIGRVNATDNNVGGLVGYSGGTVTNSYAMGSVSGGSNVGGLVGYSGGTVTNSYWDIDTTGQGTSAGGTGFNTAQMQQQANFSGWDFDSIWVIYEGHTYPLLRSFMTPIAITANDVSKTYDGVAYSGANSVRYSLIPDGRLQGSASYTYSGDTTNAGSATVTPSGFYSDQQGYLIDYNSGTLTINKANATVTANSDTKTYNGTSQTITGYTVSGLVNSENASVLDSVTLSGSGTNVGTYTISGSGSDNNYNLSFVNGTLTITKANVTVTANSDTKTYNGLTQSITGYTVSNLVNGEDASVLDSITGDSVSGTNAGVYTTSLSGSDNNYNLSFVNGTLTITKAPLIITASNDSKIYNGLAYSGGNGVSYSGFVNNETASVLGGSLSYSGDSQGAINAGTYTINPSGLNSENYTLNYIDGILTINALAIVPRRVPNVSYIQNGTAVRFPIIIFSHRFEDALTHSPTGLLPSVLPNNARVPLWQNSLIQLVNGGVHLPSGVEQEFFMAQR